MKIIKKLFNLIITFIYDFIFPNEKYKESTKKLVEQYFKGVGLEVKGGSLYLEDIRIGDIGECSYDGEELHVCLKLNQPINYILTKITLEDK